MRLVARRKTLFDDRPLEIAELTFVIKQDLSSLNSQISSLQSLSKSQHAQASRSSNVDQEGEHNKNVKFMVRVPSTEADLIGCGSTSRQTRRRVRQLQRSIGGPDKKHSSITLSDRKLCLISLVTVAIRVRSSSVCVSTLQYPHQISYPHAWLSEFKLRHTQPRPSLDHVLNQRQDVRPAATTDGGGSADKYLYKRSG